MIPDKSRKIGQTQAKCGPTYAKKPRSKSNQGQKRDGETESTSTENFTRGA
jgi:hypothetical protein